MALLIRKKSEHDLAKLEYDFALIQEKHKRIFELDFVPIFEGFFYYKYRPCIRVNLEIEGAETRV